MVKSMEKGLLCIVAAVITKGKSKPRPSIYSYLFLSIPVYSYLLLSIPMYSYLFLSIPIYFDLFLSIPYLFPSIYLSIYCYLSIYLLLSIHCYLSIYFSTVSLLMIISLDLGVLYLRMDGHMKVYLFLIYLFLSIYNLSIPIYS